jgi:hypothetical protein
MGAQKTRITPMTRSHGLKAANGSLPDGEYEMACQYFGSFDHSDQGASDIKKSKWATVYLS